MKYSVQFEHVDKVTSFFVHPLNTEVGTTVVAEQGEIKRQGGENPTQDAGLPSTF